MKPIRNIGIALLALLPVSCTKFEEKYSVTSVWELPMEGTYNCGLNHTERRYNPSMTPSTQIKNTTLTNMHIQVVRGSAINTILVKNVQGANSRMEQINATQQVNSSANDYYRGSFTGTDSSHTWTIQYFALQDSVSLIYVRQSLLSTQNRDEWYYNGRRIK